MCDKQRRDSAGQPIKLPDTKRRQDDTDKRRSVRHG